MTPALRLDFIKDKAHATTDTKSSSDKLQSKQLFIQRDVVLIRGWESFASSAVSRLFPEAIYKSKDKELMRSGPRKRGWPLIDDKEGRRKLFCFTATLIIIN